MTMLFLEEEIFLWAIMVELYGVELYVTETFSHSFPGSPILSFRDLQGPVGEHELESLQVFPLVREDLLLSLLHMNFYEIIF